MQAKQWSEGLRAQTLKDLLRVPPWPDGFLHMKHIDGGFGKFPLLELVDYTYSLQRENNLDPLQFDDAESVVAAGWAID